MSDTSQAGAESVPVAENIPAHSTDGAGPISVRDAARSLTDWRRKLQAGASPAAVEAGSQPNRQVEAPEATPAQESAGDEPGDADPPQEAPGETQEAEPAHEPPIEPPRSWTAEAKERWQSLPRETQEYLSVREQERDREVRKGQNEVAEVRKTIDGERTRLEQARQQYESALPQLLNTLQQQQQGEFADIRTMADVEKLAREDWPRYALWDAQQKKIAAVAQEVQSSQQRQQSEFAHKWTDFAKKQDALVYEKAPELADKTRAQKVADKAVEILKEVGFSDDDLTRAYNGEEALSLRDHRVQLLILDAVKYREAKASAAKPAAKPLPPVQRPGAAQPAAAGVGAQISNLEKQLANASGTKQIEIGVKLMQLRRQAAARG